MNPKLLVQILMGDLLISAKLNQVVTGRIQSSFREDLLHGQDGLRGGLLLGVHEVMNRVNVPWPGICYSSGVRRTLLLHIHLYMLLVNDLVFENLFEYDNIRALLPISCQQEVLVCENSFCAISVSG